MADATEQFACEAKSYCQWMLIDKNSGPGVAREALVRITRLYLTALALPNKFPQAVETGSPGQGSTPRSWQDLYPVLAARLPFQHYGEVFNPLPVPPEESIVGDLADDLSDIFGDVDRGLRLFETGRQEEAAWDWRFSLVHHWGEHATSAIRALHCYLATEHPDLLAAVDSLD